MPLEFCTVIANQAVNRRMDDEQTRQMIRVAATSTDVRKQKIMNAIGNARFNDGPSVREFGFSVSNQFEQLDGRVLDPPNLQYNPQVVKPSRGVWRNDRTMFKDAKSLNKWAILGIDTKVFDDVFRNLKTMVGEFLG